MAETTYRAESPRDASAQRNGREGFIPHTLALASASLEYLKARAQLAGAETKEAGVHYAVILALFAGALVVVLFGYFFLCLGLVFLAAWALGDGHNWIWVAFGMGLLHLAGAAVCVFLAKNKLAQPMFAATLNELKKDQEWLTPKNSSRH